MCLGTALNSVLPGLCWTASCEDCTQARSWLSALAERVERPQLVPGAEQTYLFIYIYVLFFKNFKILFFLAQDGPLQATSEAQRFERGFVLCVCLLCPDPVLHPAWGGLEETGLCICRPVSWRGDNLHLQVWKVPSTQRPGTKCPPSPHPRQQWKILGLLWVYLEQVFLALRCRSPWKVL